MRYASIKRARSILSIRDRRSSFATGMVALTSDPATRKLYEKAYVDGSVLVTLQIVTPAAPSNIKGSAALRLGC